MSKTRLADTNSAGLSTRTRNVVIGGIIGFLLSGAAVLTVSNAAFSAETSNESNTVATGDVVLGDDDSGGALFNVTNMAPVDPAVSSCIEVTYSGSIADPSAVRLYSGGFTDSGALGAELDVTVEVGTGGGFGDCTGFSGVVIYGPDSLDNFDASHTDYSNGLTGWDPSSTPNSRTFRISVDLPITAPSSVQGQTISDLIFTWEVQS